MRVRVCGKVWDLVWAEQGKAIPGLIGPGEHGICESPTTKGKRIAVRRSLRRSALVETLLHELLHAADWNKDEEWVHEAAHDISRVLLRVLDEVDGRPA